MSELQFTGSLKESKMTDGSGFTWEVSVIGEGVGLNSRQEDDGTVYRENFTRESIESIVPVLEGVKVKAFRYGENSNDESRDHLPINLDQYYKDIVKTGTPGNNVGVLESPRGVDVNNKLHAFATLRLSKTKQGEWLRDMLVWAYESNHRDYLGLSINGSGKTEKRIAESGERFLDITKINRPDSVDVVDTAAATGEVQQQFVRILQSYQEQELPTQEASEENPIQEVVKEESSEQKKEIIQDSETQEILDPEPKNEKDLTEGVDKDSDIIHEEVKESSEDIIFKESLDKYIHRPLLVYLDSKDIIYKGTEIPKILESIDTSSLSQLETAALHQLHEYIKEEKVNAARSLVKELVESVHQIETNPIETNPIETEQHVTEQQEEITTQTTLHESNEEIGDETMSNIEETKKAELQEEKVEDAVQDEQATIVEGTIGEGTVEEVEQKKEEKEVDEKVEEVEQKKEEPIVESGSDVKLLVESMKEFMTHQQSQVEETKNIKNELAALREQKSTYEQTQKATAQLQSVLTELHNKDERVRMDRKLQESGLLPEVCDKLKKQIGDKIMSNDELQVIIDDEAEMLSKIQESYIGYRPGNVRNTGIGDVRMGADAKDKIQVAMDRLFESHAPNSSVSLRESGDKNPAWDDPGLRFNRILEAYQVITGDVDFSGKMNDRYLREGVIGADTFEETLSNTMNRYLVNWYDTFDHAWRKIVRIRRGVRDFRAQQMNAFGGFGNLRVFNDTQAAPSPTGYKEATPPTERSGSFTPDIRAGMFTITEKLIKNDDLFAITQLLEESARSADETLMTFAFALLAGGSTYLVNNDVDFLPGTQINSDDIYSGANQRKLYAADNSGTTALDYAPLLAAINQMKRMRKMSSGTGSPLRLYGKKYLVVPLQLENMAQTIHPMNTAKEPGENYNNANILPKDLEIVAIDSLYLGDDANNWYLIEDPTRWDGVQIGFVDDEENPRIVLANNPTAGRTFSHGGFQYSVSHRYGGGVAAHEGIYGSIVA